MQRSHAARAFVHCGRDPVFELESAIETALGLGLLYCQSLPLDDTNPC